MLATFLAVPLLEDGSELLTNSISLEPVGGVLETHLTYSTGLYVVNLLRPTGFPFYPEFQKFKNFMFFSSKKIPAPPGHPPGKPAPRGWGPAAGAAACPGCGTDGLSLSGGAWRGASGTGPGCK